MNNECFYTGILNNVRRCYIDNTGISFLFGYIAEHSSSKYEEGDWFASSYINNVKVIGGRYFFHTANSVYLTDSYTSIIVSDANIDNIRMGTPPELAKQIR